MKTTFYEDNNKEIMSIEDNRPTGSFNRVKSGSLKNGGQECSQYWYRVPPNQQQHVGMIN